jgi:hypothetical protein
MVESRLTVTRVTIFLPVGTVQEKKASTFCRKKLEQYYHFFLFDASPTSAFNKALITEQSKAKYCVVTIDIAEGLDDDLREELLLLNLDILDIYEAVGCRQKEIWMTATQSERVSFRFTDVRIGGQS